MKVQMSLDEEEDGILTAGVAALLVRGKSCLPAPPPKIIAATFLGFALFLSILGACTV